MPLVQSNGIKDIFTPIECSNYLHENIRDSELAVFDGYAHTHHWEDLERYNRLTADFLNKAK